MTKNRNAYLDQKNVEIPCVKIPYGEGAIFADSHAVNLTAGTTKPLNVEEESGAPSYMTAKSKSVTWGSTRGEGAVAREERSQL